MKKLIPILILFVSYAYGQEVKKKSYVFLNPSIVENISQYEKAFSTANMSSFRYKNKSNIIEFVSGLKVELFSGETLVNNGITVDFTKLLAESKTNNKEYIFSISNDGSHILRKYLKLTGKKIK